jgi:pimeloyl-ACP methyl ester carboxylesterase
MPNRTLRIVLVFGLDDGKLNFPSVLSPVWNRNNVRLYPVGVGWRDGGEYPQKQQMVLDLVDSLLAAGDPVALIGISAGASLAVNVYQLRPQIVGLVNVCGALRLIRDMPSRFAKSVGSSKAFRESVAACEESQRLLSSAQRSRILIMEPWQDFVPISTMQLSGANVHRLAGINHSVSIVTAMLLYRRTMLRFLKQTA